MSLTVVLNDADLNAKKIQDNFFPQAGFFTPYLNWPSIDLPTVRQDVLDMGIPDLNKMTGTGGKLLAGIAWQRVKSSGDLFFELGGSLHYTVFRTLFKWLNDDKRGGWVISTVNSEVCTHALRDPLVMSTAIREKNRNLTSVDIMSESMSDDDSSLFEMREETNGAITNTVVEFNGSITRRFSRYG